MLPEFKPVVDVDFRGGGVFGGENGLSGRRDDRACLRISSFHWDLGRRGRMFAMGIIGWLAGVLCRKGVLRRGRLAFVSSA